MSKTDLQPHLADVRLAIALEAEDPDDALGRLHTLISERFPGQLVRVLNFSISTITANEGQDGERVIHPVPRDARPDERMANSDRALADHFGGHDGD